MQLGSRWLVGEQPHRGVPSELHTAIQEQEELHPSAHSWTLTWLEGRPRCQLDDCLIVTIDRDGAHQVITLTGQSGNDIISGDDDDDDWLA